MWNWQFNWKWWEIKRKVVVGAKVEKFLPINLWNEQRWGKHVPQKAGRYRALREASFLQNGWIFRKISKGRGGGRNSTAVRKISEFLSILEKIGFPYFYCPLTPTGHDILTPRKQYSSSCCCSVTFFTPPITRSKMVKIFQFFCTRPERPKGA